MKRLLKSWLLLSSLILQSYCCYSQSLQNLVLNGSFETYTQCPSSVSKITFAPPSIGPTTNNTPYFNSCSLGWNVPFYAGVGSSYPAYLLAKEGQAYTTLMMLRVYGNLSPRFYVQLELSDTLVNGKCYYVEFFAANWQRVKYRTNNLSACFTNDTLPTHLLSPGIIPNIQPHIMRYGNPLLEDTVNWVNISGIYDAIGNEKYITIGNFKDNSNTDTVNIYSPGTFAYTHSDPSSFVFIDAVSVYSINPTGALPWSYRDTAINKGDSVYIGNKIGGLNFHPQWYKENGVYLKTNAGIMVSPTITTKYYVQYTLCGVQRTDTVKVTVLVETDLAIKHLNELNNSLSVFPNPATDVLNFQCAVINNNTAIKILVYDNLGRAIRENELLFKEGKAQLNTSGLNEGIYFLQLRVREAILNRKVVISR